MAQTDERPPLTYLILDRLTQPAFLLAVASGLLLWWLVGRLLTGAVPDQMRELVAALAGFITGQMVGPAWNFFLGTNKASEEKSRALADNAAAMRQAGLPVGRRATDPQQVEVVNPPESPVPVEPAKADDTGELPADQRLNP